MDSVTISDTFDQVISGEDIPQIGRLLKSLSPEAAATVPEGSPYSILTNLEHTDFWQRVWLARLDGTRRPNFRDDWRVPDASEYEAIRASFLANLARAKAIADSWPVDHHMKSDAVALRTLVSLAIHTTYHIGQIKLMARMIKRAGKA